MNSNLYLYHLIAYSNRSFGILFNEQINEINFKYPGKLPEEIHINFKYIKRTYIDANFIKYIMQWNANMFYLSDLMQSKVNNYYIVPILDNEIDFKELCNMTFNNSNIIYDTLSGKYGLLGFEWYYTIEYFSDNDIKLDQCLYIEDISSIILTNLNYQYFCLAKYGLSKSLKLLSLYLNLLEIKYQNIENQSHITQFTYNKRNIELGRNIVKYNTAMYVICQSNTSNIKYPKFIKKYCQSLAINMMRIEQYVDVKKNNFKSGSIEVIYNHDNLLSFIGSVSTNSFSDSLDLINMIFDVNCNIIDFINVVKEKYSLDNNYTELEKYINYKFKNRYLIKQAFISNNRIFSYIGKLLIHYNNIIEKKYITDYNIVKCLFNDIYLMDISKKNINVIYALIGLIVIDSGEIESLRGIWNIILQIN
jgi:hypothetical protein